MNFLRNLRALWRARRDGADRFLRFAAPGHYYSPVPSWDDIRRGLGAAGAASLPGIELREASQRDWWDQLAPRMSSLPWSGAPRTGLRYGYANGFFEHGDAEVYAATLSTVRPGRVIEVGSGYSTALLLDAVDQGLCPAPALTVIEPDPARLQALLQGTDAAGFEMLKAPVQDVDLARFGSLDAGDLLFVDSSHVGKCGSDVLHLLFHVLPRLRPGVLIHLHDIFWPFEYPRAWFEEGRAWNEAYLVRAFLQWNTRFEIVFFNSWFQIHEQARVRAVLPDAPGLGSSLWLRRTAGP